MKYCSWVRNNTRRLLHYTAHMGGSYTVKGAKGVVVVSYTSSDRVGDTCMRVTQDISLVRADGSSAVKEFEY